MSIVVAALTMPDLLIALLLAALGVFIFALVRPTKRDPEMEFWSAFVKQYRKKKGAGISAGEKSDKGKSDDSVGPPGPGSVGFSCL
jgi:hypothetical protein